MELEIKKLAPELAEDYARFFDVTPHDDHTAKDELPCYCVTWRSDASYGEDNRHWFTTRQERRRRAIQFVREGHLQGYLAYSGGEAVGWCNATANCRLGVDYLRAFWPVEERRDDERILSVFCFMVAPKAQRLGVATALLEHACREAARDGFDFVEAYANVAGADHICRGHYAMYKKCGFTAGANREGRVVMRRALK